MFQFESDHSWVFFPPPSQSIFIKISTVQKIVSYVYAKIQAYENASFFCSSVLYY